MKLIHTSDWHLGQNFYGYDRSIDHARMIFQLVELVKKEKPDALVIAGDIYDVPVPGTAIQKAFAEYIVELHNACPTMTIVCISGNHDSASRHEVHQTPWEALNVRMVGKVDMENLSSNIISLPDKGWIVAVPYTNDRFLTDEFYKDLEQTTKEITGEKLPIVYVGHAAINGCNFQGHDIMNGRFVGGIESTNISEIGSFYDYVALGHIHKAQTFDNGRARYSGSPLPVGFDEIRSGYEHSFSIVEIESHNSTPVIRTKEVACGCPLVNIPAEGYACWDEVMEELKNFPADIEAYLRLNVLLKDQQMLPYNKDHQIALALEGKKALYAAINPTREVSGPRESSRDGILSLTMEELKKIEPLDVLKSYAASNDIVFSDEYNEMFNTVIRIINNPENEN
jgi:exonuclease SbcD